MKKQIIILSLMCYTLAVYSQSIKDTDFSQSGNSIIVTYNLNLPDSRSAEIDLYLSTDGGRKYTGPLKAVTGDVGEVSSGGNKSITWRVFDEFEKLEGDITFSIEAKLIRLPYKHETYAAYNISGTSAIGFTYGKVKTIGWYVRIKTNGKFAFADYETDDNQITNYTGDGYYVFSDKVKRSRLALTGGLLYRMHPSLYLYAGGGFGYRGLLWNAKEYSLPLSQELGEIWAKHNTSSALGAELELGSILRIKMINLSFGINIINFNFFEVNGGIGVFF